jgi:3-carboxy-cis,cis-muconate cycloisomerase
MATPLDSDIFAGLFTDEHISRLLNDEAFVRALVEVEVALATAEARAGVIPAEAAERIRKMSADKVEITALARGTLRSGFPIIPLVQELRRQLAPDSAPFVHWGATTQDIMDTALVLQMRAATNLLGTRLRTVIDQLASLADHHRATVLAGRTHGQQALPITFGLKAAGWLAPLARHVERLDQLLPRLLVVQCGGAAGTLAAMGDKGLRVTAELAKELRLGVPTMPWHAQRDSLVEFAGWLSLVAGSLGKMAQDIILQAQTEVGEVGESAEPGRGGSSTMPQKSNPIASELILAAARTNASLLSAMHQAQIQEHERATHGWQVEWLTLPQMVALTGGALKHAVFLTKNLQVDAAAMKTNVARGNGLLLAEAVVFALAKTMARSEAEELVKKACAVAAAENRSLIDIVERLAAIKPGEVDWQALAKPENYLGETARIIDRVIERAKKLS